MLLYATLSTLLACSGLVYAAPASDTGGVASKLDASSKAAVAIVAYQEMCYLTLFDAEEVTSLKYGKDTLAQDENGRDVYINDGYKKDSNGKEYYYEEACYKSSKVDGKTQSNEVASSSTTDSSPFTSLIGNLGLDDGVSGFLTGLVSGNSLGLGGLARFVKRQFDGKTIGACSIVFYQRLQSHNVLVSAIIGQPADDSAASSSSAPAPTQEAATPDSPDFFGPATPSPTPTPTTTAAPSPTAVDPLEIANGFGGIQSVGNALPGRIGAQDLLGPAISGANAPTEAAFGAATSNAGNQASLTDAADTPDARPSTSAFTPAPGPPGSSFASPTAEPVDPNNDSDDAASQATQFQPASPPPVVQTPASTFTPAAPPPTTDAPAPVDNAASPAATTQQIQPTPSSPVVQTAAPPVDSAASPVTLASSVDTPNVDAPSSTVAVDTPSAAASSATVDAPATSTSSVPLRIYVAAASPSSSSVDPTSTTTTSLTVVSLAPTAVPAQATK